MTGLNSARQHSERRVIHCNSCFNGQFCFLLIGFGVDNGTIAPPTVSKYICASGSNLVNYNGVLAAHSEEMIVVAVVGFEMAVA